MLGKIPSIIASRPPENIPYPTPVSRDASLGPLPPKFAHILSRISGCLVAFANSGYCVGGESEGILNTSTMLDKFTGVKGSVVHAPASVLEASDAIMALPEELRLLDFGEGEESQPIKRVRLAVAESDPYNPPTLPIQLPLPTSASTDPSASLSDGTLPVVNPYPPCTEPPPGTFGMPTISPEAGEELRRKLVGKQRAPSI